MKKLLLILLLAVTPLIHTSCSAPASARVQAVQTLKAVGHTAESAVATAAQLYNDGVITEAQLRTVTAFYNTKFQPSFRVAVLAVNANYDLNAPAEVVALAAQLTQLVISLQKH